METRKRLYSDIVSCTTSGPSFFLSMDALEKLFCRLSLPHVCNLKTDCCFDLKCTIVLFPDSRTTRSFSKILLYISCDIFRLSYW
jgi:hypothetical protein